MHFSRPERAIQIAWAVNFITFLVVAGFIGGDAINGHASAAHFYLASHGKLTEVSRATFIYSEAHCVAVWLLTGLTLVTLLRARWRDRKQISN